MIVSENGGIDSRFGNVFKTAIKVVYKRNCRDPNNENVIFETTPEVFKYMFRR